MEYFAALHAALGWVLRNNKDVSSPITSRLEPKLTEHSITLIQFPLLNWLWGYFGNCVRCGVWAYARDKAGVFAKLLAFYCGNPIGLPVWYHDTPKHRVHDKICSSNCRQSQWVCRSLVGDEFDQVLHKSNSHTMYYGYLSSASRIPGFQYLGNIIVKCSWCSNNTEFMPLVGILQDCPIVILCDGFNKRPRVAILSPLHCDVAWVPVYDTLGYVPRFKSSMRNHYYKIVGFDPTDVDDQLCLPPFIVPDGLIRGPVWPQLRVAQPSQLSIEVQAGFIENNKSIIDELAIDRVLSMPPSLNLSLGGLPSRTQRSVGSYLRGLAYILFGNKFHEYPTDVSVYNHVFGDRMAGNSNKVVVILVGQSDKFYFGYEAGYSVPAMVLIPIMDRYQTHISPLVWTEIQLGLSNCRNSSNVFLFGCGPGLYKMHVPPHSEVSPSPMIGFGSIWDDNKPSAYFEGNRFIGYNEHMVNKACTCSIHTLDHKCGGYSSSGLKWKDVVDKKMLPKVKPILNMYDLVGNPCIDNGVVYQILNGDVTHFAQYVVVSQHLNGGAPLLVIGFKFGSIPSFHDIHNYGLRVYRRYTVLQIPSDSDHNRYFLVAP